MPLIPTSPEEARLAQLYSVWSEDQRDEYKTTSVVLAIVGNGEDNHALCRVDFMLAMLEEHFVRKQALDLLLLRAFFVWWTRAELQTREVEPLLTQVHGPVKTILQASVANAWYKSWNWALSERPENAGLYEASARLHWDSTLDLFRRESQVPALRGILQIALKDEPWFETKRNMEVEAIRIKPQA